MYPLQCITSSNDPHACAEVCFESKCGIFANWTFCLCVCVCARFVYSSFNLYSKETAWLVVCSSGSPKNRLDVRSKTWYRQSIVIFMIVMKLTFSMIIKKKMQKLCWMCYFFAWIQWVLLGQNIKINLNSYIALHLSIPL